MMKAPTYLEKYISNVKEDEYLSMDIKSEKEELFEIYYYGELFKGDNLPNHYIVDFGEYPFTPCKVIAKGIDSKKEILLFDNALYGYNAMFCDEFDKEKLEKRELKKYDFPPSKIHIDLGYSIDYESEKEDYDFDEDGKVFLINKDTVTWEEVKRNGFDYISILCYAENGEKIEILSLELA